MTRGITESNSISTMTPNSISVWTHLPLLFICCFSTELGLSFFPWSLSKHLLQTETLKPFQLQRVPWQSPTNAAVTPSQAPAAAAGTECSGSALCIPAGCPPRRQHWLTHLVLKVPFPWPKTFPASTDVSQHTFIALRSAAVLHRGEG